MFFANRTYSLLSYLRGTVAEPMEYGSPIGRERSSNHGARFDGPRWRYVLSSGPQTLPRPRFSSGLSPEKNDRSAWVRISEMSCFSLKRVLWVDVVKLFFARCSCHKVCKTQLIQTDSWQTKTLTFTQVFWILLDWQLAEDMTLIFTQVSSILTDSWRRMTPSVLNHYRLTAGRRKIPSFA
mgnify:CR=1 FL=1